ncbi:probable proline--tRNA ligase, mitochondrial [Epargyreus clarus]|uniref:probable proline--tRNA ligase, mitochondrial n=1 Tax=Epargyreus clarus TaxID=520877 RepID=UPI003C2FEB6B
MRYVSQLFQPVITIPKGAKIKNTEITCKSQKLLLECGLVRPTSAGFFALLPLARRALDKLEALVIDCLEAAGAQRLSLPCLTSAKLWEASGRLADVGTELLKVEDRHGKKFLLAPTHEEAIADLLADVGPLSYKQLPLILYQITSKYRDEFRPKHGLLRSREFSMLDAYSVHRNAECANIVYGNVSNAYRDLFGKLELNVHRVKAPSGDMGGELSHEWQLPVSAGEDTIAICPSCSHAVLSEEKSVCEQCGKEMAGCNSVEVGHTFILGTKYSDPLKASFVPPEGPPTPLIMSCYGIGITRLLAASLEALSTEKALRWPRAIAPYSVIVIGPKEGSKEWSNAGKERADEISHQLSSVVGGDLLVDDRHPLTIGKRLMMADRMGYPSVVVCGRAATENPPRFELYRSGADAPVLLTADELIRTVRTDCSDDKRNKAVI